MSVTKAEATLEAILRDWLTEVEIDIYIAKKRGFTGDNPAHTCGNYLEIVPQDITLQEIEEVVIPTIKEQLGF